MERFNLLRSERRVFVATAAPFVESTLESRPRKIHAHNVGCFSSHKVFSSRKEINVLEN